jgi:hypothetical protein
MDAESREFLDFDDRAAALIDAAGSEGTTPDGFFYTYGDWAGGADHGDLWKAFDADGNETPGDMYAPVQHHVRTTRGGYAWEVQVDGETVASGTETDPVKALAAPAAVSTA